MGLQAKHSFMMSLFIMNLGFASAMRDITAETVRISTHSSGRKPPMAPEMMSARILTTTVHSPAAFFTGIINRMIPVIDGIINMAFSFALLLVSILSPPSNLQSRRKAVLSQPLPQQIALAFTLYEFSNNASTSKVCNLYTSNKFLHFAICLFVKSARFSHDVSGLFRFCITISP